MSTLRLAPILFLSFILNVTLMPSPEGAETFDDSDEQIVQPQRSRPAIHVLRLLPARLKRSRPRESGIQLRQNTRGPAHLSLNGRPRRKIPSTVFDSPVVAESH
jgi:hypothetical protein